VSVLYVWAGKGVTDAKNGILAVVSRMCGMEMDLAVFAGFHDKWYSRK